MLSTLDSIITVPLFAKGTVGVCHYFGTKIAPGPPVTAMGGPAARHIGAFVPAENAGAGAENAGVLYTAEEFRVGVVRIHGAVTPTR